MPLSKIRKAAMHQIGKILASEKTMQVLSDPRVQKLIGKAFTFQEEMRRHWNEGVALAARRLNLATRDDLTSLKRAVRNLESQIAHDDQVQ